MTTKLHVSSALGQRSTRVAVLVGESILFAVDRIDEQLTAVVEALIEHFQKKILQSLIDYLVGADKQPPWDRYSEGSGGSAVDNQFEPCRKQDWQVGRCCSL